MPGMIGNLVSTLYDEIVSDLNLNLPKMCSYGAKGK